MQIQRPFDLGISILVLLVGVYILLISLDKKKPNNAALPAFIKSNENRIAVLRRTSISIIVGGIILFVFWLFGV